VTLSELDSALLALAGRLFARADDAETIVGLDSLVETLGSSL